MALYVVYAVATYVLSALLNMYIPHCMRIVGEEGSDGASGLQRRSIEGGIQTINDTKMSTGEVNEFVKKTEALEPPAAPRKYGFKMSIAGGVGTSVGGIVALILVIILAQTLPVTEGQTAGLLITTVFGFITILGSIVLYLGLPAVPAKPSKDWKDGWLGLLTPFRDLLQRKNMLLLLLSYTIYTDTSFALNSVTAQLYFTEVKPDTLEYSLYTIAANIFILVCTLGFYILQKWRSPFRLEYWLVIGYALILVVPLWGCIGLADSINFGYKVTGFFPRAVYCS